VDARVERAPSRRNVYAIAGIWCSIASWASFFVALEADSGTANGLFVVVSAAAIVLATAGVVAIRTRGEPVAAIVGLIFSLALPLLYVLFLVLLFLLIGTGGGMD
jgi:hypothetical protein